MRHHLALALFIFDKDAQASRHDQEKRGVVLAAAL
jgi:hypothetical protein